MTAFQWRPRNPFDEMSRMQQQMNSLFRTWQEPTAYTYPPVNVYDNGNQFVVRAEVPGLDMSKLDLGVAGDVLTLKGERGSNEALNGSYHRRERGAYAFHRSLTLPDTVDVTQVKAQYHDGVLEVTLPRAPEVRPRKINVVAK